MSQALVALEPSAAASGWVRGSFVGWLQAAGFRECDDGSPLLIQNFHQQGIGIDRRSYPPLLLRTKAKDS
jgi:hypothetical protein